MQFIYTENEREGIRAMADYIVSHLAQDKKVLWLICGGSNIPYAFEAMHFIRDEAGDKIQNLTVGQTDERYGEVGHKDSNWQQLIETGFNFADIRTLPILIGKPLEETVEAYDIDIQAAFAAHDVIVAQFGMGADGHVAGMLPHTPGIHANKLVFGYESEPFIRITLTPPAFSKINAAFAFVYGESKQDAVQTLAIQDLSLDIEPAQILKTIPESYLYSDQL